MTNTYGLTERSWTELMDILRSVPEIEEAVIYGSRARGDYWAASDVDLSLRGKQLTRRSLRQLGDRLYESHIPLFFDTHIYADIKSPQFKASVDRDGRVIYRRDAETDGATNKIM